MQTTFNTSKTTASQCKCVSVDLDDLFFAQGKVTDMISKIQNADLIIGTCLWERYYTLKADFILLLIDIKKKSTPIIVFANTIIKDTDVVRVMKAFDVKVIFVDFFFWRVYREIIYKQKNQVNPTWNYKSDKFLFLPGKSWKPYNRVTLLWELYQKNLLSNCIWSFHVYGKEKLMTLDTLVKHGVDIARAKSFIDKFQSNPDQAKFIYTSYESCHYGGIPYDSNLYSESKFRVIAETDFMTTNSNLPWITEKTWLTIVNRCPFLMAGDRGTLDYLETLGFQTFAQYQKNADYDKITSPHKRIDAIVENTQAWLSNQDHMDSINQDVEHNYRLFLDLGQVIQEKILADLNHIDLDLDLDIIPTMDNLSGF